jgi:hypothetical protein
MTSRSGLIIALSSLAAGADTRRTAIRRRTALLKLPSFVLLGPGIFRCPGSRYGVTGANAPAIGCPVTDRLFLQ